MKPQLIRVLCRLAACCVACLRLSAEPKSEPFSVSADERAWLAAHPVIRVGCDPDFRPFCFRDATGAMRGIDADLLAEIGRRLGVRFELRTAATWTEVYQAGQRRELDLLSSTADMPERRSHFLFTRPYVKFPVTIVARSDGPFAVTASDLRTMRVAGARDYAPTLAFRRDYPGVPITEFDTIDQALAAVSRGTADAAVTNLANASYIIKTRGFANLKIAGVLAEFFEERLAVRNDWPELAALLDRTLAAIPPDEMATILDRWVKVDYAAVIRWDLVRRWGAIGALFALTVIGLVTWRNIGLRRELEKRRIVQQELEAANAQLRLANTELGRHNDDKAELMRVAAHDLRSPLAAVMLATDALADTSSGIGRDGVVDTISRSAQQMARLIDDLLEVHALEDGKRVFREERVAPDRVLLGAVETLEGTAQRKRIKLDVAGVHPVGEVTADPAALRQVFENLLSNALKFSPPDREVRLRTLPWDDFVRIEVSDQGPGVPAGERERIFTKYARGSARPTGGEKSTGLGLAIVRDIVAAMNGRVWCQESSDGGAAFVVALPCCREPV